MARLLWVDLSSGKIGTRDFPHLEGEVLGGLGLNTKLVGELVPAGCDPLGADNVLCFGVGPLVGTLLPTACRTEATAKSPLSGRFGTANAGGEWGPHLKRAGFDGIVLTGQAVKPVYLVVTDSDAQLYEAGWLWGKDTWETVDAIRERHGEEFQVASIGPAGEKLVRFASIQNNYYAAWGRTGMGAVMGSKLVKAVAVKGSGDIKVADRQDFIKIMKEGFRRVKEDSSFGPFSRFGSMIVSDAFNAIGGLPGHNFTVGSLPTWQDTRSRKAFEQGYKQKDLACFACPIACCHWSRVPEGELAGYETKGLEVTFVLEFGAKLGLEQVPHIFRSVEVCNRYGMDVISAAGVVAFTIEAGKKGLLAAKEVPPDFGDFMGIVDLLERIAFRQGLGDVLAEGSMRAGRLLPGTDGMAMHVKGVEIPVRDPRGKWDVWTMGYLTNTRGGDSLRTRSPVEAVMGKVHSYLAEALEVPAEHVAAMDMPPGQKKAIFGDPPNRVDIPNMACYAEDLITIINCVGMCIRPPVLRSLGPDWYARSLTAVTGQHYTEEQVMAAARRVWNMQHEFNLREGEQVTEYAFPDRFYLEEITGMEGRKPPLDRNSVAEAVRAYFITRGWDPDTGQVL